jgi:hypothetical protein
MSRRYSREEERALAWPLPLKDDCAVCDLGDCMRTAAYVLPGCFICPECLAAHTVVTPNGARYRIPVEKIAVSFAGRQRRRRDYREMLDAVRTIDGGIRRTAKHDDLLAALITVAVEDVIRSSGALP